MRQQGGKGADHFRISLHTAIVAPYHWHYGPEEQKARWPSRLQSGQTGPPLLQLIYLPHDEGV